MVKHEYYGIDEEIDDYLSHIEELEDHREFPKKPFTMDKPVVILTSPYAGSAADTFSVMAKAMDNFTLMGLTTHGATGNIYDVSLSDGSKYTLSIMNCYGPNKKSIWNRGAEPDIELWTTPEDLLNGEDTVLNAAIETLQRQIKERTGE